MSDLGLLLRKAREQRGYTLDDIQEATKIRKRYLEAIEQGDYKVLPGSFYVRAFVKTYAETVGLDAEEVLRLYHKELPKPAAPETAAPENVIKPKSRSVQHNDRWGKLAVTLLMWLFPLLILVVVYIYVVQNLPSKAGKADPETPITTDTASPSLSPSPSSTPTITAPPASSPANSPSPEPVTLTETRKSGSTTYYDVGPAGAHTLKVVSTGSWVGVQENSRKGKYLYQGTPDNTLTFPLNGPIYVNLGNAKNAVVSIDDVVVDDGDVSGSRKFVFTPVEGTAGANEANGETVTQP
ncbi:XRE family transcriptional regulator [Cohnella xylanilytica]|uniref:Helix-turn-helix domain-containing protein n=1 Tax=Cohnella xylanilytica TaxID=557555 RepID=A0A841TPI6_9BACL|nr:helix-turn-helix domain-containing protein [Cohnella xylanilytica]MBB6690236.1 helix-turn-helix domain-containing protein [Cohnella xylanilytica]GIO11616.1 XRE family transcriptional regulator [Cohnella xylanilytica]